MYNITMQLVYFMPALAMMLWYSWQLTLISILASLLAFFVSMLFGNKASGAEKLVIEKNDLSLGAIQSLLGIVVTHNLDEELLGRYDEILVMRDGQLIERGSFEDLVSRDTYFRSLYRVSA